MKDKERIGKLIAEARKKKGLTLSQLSELSGVAAPNIARVESGKSSTGIDLLSKICKHIDCKIDVVQHKK